MLKLLYVPHILCFIKINLTAYCWCSYQDCRSFFKAQKMLWNREEQGGRWLRSFSRTRCRMQRCFFHCPNLCMLPCYSVNETGEEQVRSWVSFHFFSCNVVFCGFCNTLNSLSARNTTCPSYAMSRNSLPKSTANWSKDWKLFNPFCRYVSRNLKNSWGWF